MSPIAISGQPTIPAGSTVIVDPGVQITLAASTYLIVNGQLTVQGASADRVRIVGPTTAAVLTINGSVDFAFADVDVQVGAAGFTPVRGQAQWSQLDAGIFRDCTFGPSSLINASWHVNVIERCTYAGSRPFRIRHAARVRDFTSPRTLHLREGLFSLGGVSVSGATEVTPGMGAEESSGLYVTGHIIPTFIDGVSLTGNAGAGVFTRFGNVLIGENTTIQNNLVGVQLDRTAGLLTGSHVPTSGNTLNGFIPVGFSPYLAPLPPRDGPVANAPAAGPDWLWGAGLGWDASGFTDCVWGNADVPYVATGTGGAVNGGSLLIAPGVSTMLAPGATLNTFETGRQNFRGTPQSPLLFTRLNPGTPWQGTTFNSTGIISCATFEGASIAMGSGGGTTMPEVLDCVIRNNDTGTMRGFRVRKSQFLGNLVGASEPRTTVYQTRVQLDNPGEPNAFIGNTKGVLEDPTDTVNQAVEARNNYWGSPTGPRAWNNPAGTGDPVDDNVASVPFLVSPPDFTDRLPIVRIKPTGLLEPLARTTIRWDASDDRLISRFRVSYATASNVDNRAYITLAELPGTARECQITVPNVGFFNSRDTFIRVTAIDSAGQEGVDEYITTIPNSLDRPLQVNVVSDFPGRVVRPGELIDPAVTRTTFDPAFSNAFEVHLVLDNDGILHHVGNGDTTSGGLYLSAEVPTVSTDQARLAIKFQGTGNLQKWFFTQPFSIRPDPRVGDAPPVIALEPMPAQMRAGSSVTLNWTASDDTALRMFRILQSTDEGRTWHLVEDNVPANARSRSVQLAPGDGFSSLRFRVVAVDALFQNSSATSAAVAVNAGQACLADFDSSGAVAPADIFEYLNAWFTGDARADINGGGLTPQDMFDFLNLWFTGC